MIALQLPPSQTFITSAEYHRQGSDNETRLSGQCSNPFEPYDEENPEARAAGKALIAEIVASRPKRRTFVFVNNRLEGNAISTIGAMFKRAELRDSIGESQAHNQVSRALPSWRAALGTSLKIELTVGWKGSDWHR
jgi:hypothetical protein